ncbi:OsmC family protein [Celerinatantimonas yamalensis]|uniref:OsmC family protein n=1 Tax=Celerinatantimonas yamalensis TaxID=559956 RepID=A0ABW9G7U4_9GAMM
MQAKVKWAGDMQFIGESGSGHALVMDGNGAQTAASPMEVLLMAAGGCSSVDVVSILQKARQPFHDCYVELTTERADTTPRVFTKIHLHFVLTGSAKLSDKQVARAVDLSMEKYCSVSLMLSKHCPIEHSYEIRISE